MNAGGGKGNGSEQHPTAVAVGMFDGVHLGHRDLLARLRHEAEIRGYKPVAVTFAEHPAAVLRPDAVPLSLSSPDEKIRLLHDAGIERVELMHFTPQLAALPAEAFLEDLKKSLNMQLLVPGFNTSIGSDRLKGEKAFTDTCNRLGIGMVQGEEFRMPGSGARVCSSEIRRLLAEGDVETAAEMLGRRYTVEGTVVGGNRLGRNIGFPTANISPAFSGQAIPARGVYVAEAEVDGAGRFGAMVNIGLRPTVNDNRGSVIEAHLIGFDGDIYGANVRLEFIDRLRDERTFPSLDHLRAQLEADCTAAIERLAARM